MGRQRICAYCGTPINWLTSVLFNNCCSYNCDIALEEETKYGKPKSVPNNKYNENKNHTATALDPDFLSNKEDDDDEYDYGFDNSNFNNNKRKDVFYPQIENPAEGFDFISKKDPVPIETKPINPYERGEHYENKRSGFYDDIDGKPNYYDNGEVGFYSNRNPGYYEDTLNDDGCDDDSYDDGYYDSDDNNTNNDDSDDDDYNDDSNTQDDDYYNEDEDYQIIHDEDEM